MIKTILLVEDESDMLDIVRFRLTKEGFDVLASENGQHAIATIRKREPDLVVLDLMLPLVDGFDVLRFIRKNHPALPVIILSAKGEESDIVVGLELGADDYVVKPFSMSVLVARIKAVLRRYNGTWNPPDMTTLDAGPVQMDHARVEVSLDGNPIRLTRMEYRLLAALVSANGCVLTRHQLLQQATGEEPMSSDRTIDVHLTSLRNKMGDYRDMIETVRGVGYRFRKKPEL